MSSNNIDVFMPVIILMFLGVAIVLLAFLASRILRPSNPTEKKLTPYECGEEPMGSAWSQFNVRFYVVGLIFIIFDVESALMFPVATVFRQFVSEGNGALILFEVIMFIFILVAGIAYCWKKGDLDWVKSFHLQNEAKFKKVKE
ncbi:MAG: NADH-quinone oxidoreductase subunit A [Bacteriovoracaceae bacterium]